MTRRWPAVVALVCATQLADGLSPLDLAAKPVDPSLDVINVNVITQLNGKTKEEDTTQTFAKQSCNLNMYGAIFVQNFKKIPRSSRNCEEIKLLTLCIDLQQY